MPASWCHQPQLQFSVNASLGQPPDGAQNPVPAFLAVQATISPDVTLAILNWRQKRPVASCPRTASDIFS